MFNLLLVGMFTAFFISLLDPVRSFLSIMVSSIAINATFAIFFSALATFLLEPEFNSRTVVKVFAGSFFGPFLVIIIERISTYQADVIRAVGQER